MRKQNGITLIALVISIIVMLILAGVSINAIVGENGVLSRAQYSSFLNEMAAVEEAVQLWKAGELIESKGQVNTAIPANGLWETNNLIEENMSEATKRLIGEIGYYRVWSIAGNMPENNILSIDDSLYNAFKGEFVGYPAGVQDLYYLNNEALDLDKDKIYLIDATTSMVYSMTGISINGVRCYSTYMAKALMGNGTSPVFAEAEVSGTGTGGALAGNVQEEFLPDGSPNPEYNPNGFQIIADKTNSNIYKLYNNGELYGKGKKGPLLNTSIEEMENLNPNKWSKLTIPTEIPGYNTKNIKIIPGYDTIYVIDSNKNLWAWGDNSNNKLGLTNEEQVEYTGREAIKLNINNKRVERVFPLVVATFVLTYDSNLGYELYATGFNEDGELGVGEVFSDTVGFKKVIFENPENITKISAQGNQSRRTLIFSKDEAGIKIYYAGSTTNSQAKYGKEIFKNTEYAGKDITTFIEIGKNGIGAVAPVNMKSYHDWNKNEGNNFICLGEDGNAYWYNLKEYVKIELDGNDGEIIEIKICSPGSAVFKRILNDGNIQFWGHVGYTSSKFYMDWLEDTTKFYLLNDYFPNEYDAGDIKDFSFDVNKSIIFLTNSGTVFGSGHNSGLGINLTSENSSSFVNITNNANLIEIDYLLNCKYTDNNFLILVDKAGNMYVTQQSDIVFRDNMLQKNWIKIADNVKKFNASTHSNCIAYIDKNNDLWVAGNDSYVLGINTETVEKVPNFVRLKDYLKDEEIYNNIDSKVTDYEFATKTLYILTNDEDNKSLYVCGHYLSYSWTTYSYIGTGLEEHSKKPTKILDCVEKICASSLERLALRNVEGKFELYVWGKSDGNSIPLTDNLIPTKWEEGDSVFQNADEVDLWCISYDKSFIGIRRGNTYDLQVCGRDWGTSVNGLGHTVKTYTSVIYDNTSVIKKFIAGNNGGASFMFFTEDNNIYGFGRYNLMGGGNTSVELQRTPIILNIKENQKKLVITNITGGSGWYIITTSDGRVFGTGSNKYGILGRWIGVDRDTPNSRYKTAFDWVECPELEI